MISDIRYLHLHDQPELCSRRPQSGKVKPQSLSEAVAKTKVGTTQSSFVFHHANAWLDENAQTVHTDSVCYLSYPDNFAVRFQSQGFASASLGCMHHVLGLSLQHLRTLIEG